MIEIDSYLDVTAAEIAQNYEDIYSQREAFGRATVVMVEKPLFAVQDKQTGGDDPHTYGEFDQVFAFRDGNRQNKFKEVVCFAKRDDNKLTKIAVKVSATIPEQIAASNKLAMDSILDSGDKMNLKG